jgi:uncharacterized protein YdaT
MPDRRTDLLALIKQHGQPIARETEKEDRRAKRFASVKQGDQPVFQRAEEEVPHSKQPEVLKQSGQSKSSKKSAALKKHSEPVCRIASEEISHTGLLEVLKQQLSVVNELIELGLVETEAFKIDDVARISSIVDKQQDAINRMQALEQHKAEVMNSMGPDAPVMKNIGTMSCLIERVKKLQQINETNHLLARMSLSYIRMMQKALGIAAKISYDQKGKNVMLPEYMGKLNASA